tara:strand:+ start:309 stop:797 length:489 start_codon:yes stop_codon:yes gene_type:complete
MKVLRFIFKNKKNFNSEEDKNIDLDPFIKISKIVKEARSKNNLTQEDLSNISKIPLSTIKAIENNVAKSRPEYPFMRSILLKLEKCLLLKELKLVSLIKEEKISKNKPSRFNFIINKFDPIYSWQGNVIYILIILCSIFLLNIYFLNLRTVEFKYIEKKISE